MPSSSLTEKRDPWSSGATLKTPMIKMPWKCSAAGATKMERNAPDIWAARLAEEAPKASFMPPWRRSSSPGGRNPRNQVFRVGKIVLVKLECLND